MIIQLQKLERQRSNKNISFGKKRTISNNCPLFLWSKVKKFNVQVKATFALLFWNTDKLWVIKHNVLNFSLLGISIALGVHSNEVIYI